MAADRASEAPVTLASSELAEMSGNERIKLDSKGLFFVADPKQPHSFKDEVGALEQGRAETLSNTAKELSKFFEEGDPKTLAKNLLSFDPREAVKILHSLDDERASALVNALPADRIHDYLEAYRAQTVKNGTQKKP